MSERSCHIPLDNGLRLTSLAVDGSSAAGLLPAAAGLLPAAALSFLVVRPSFFSPTRFFFFPAERDAAPDWFTSAEISVRAGRENDEG